jgi:hypothetical protein
MVERGESIASQSDHDDHHESDRRSEGIEAMTDYPRCATCRWWWLTVFLGSDRLGSDRKICHRISDYDYVELEPKLAEMRYGEGSESLITHRDFGCVLYESVPNPNAVDLKITAPDFGCVQHEPRQTEAAGVSFEDAARNLIDLNESALRNGWGVWLKPPDDKPTPAPPIGLYPETEG